MQWLFVLVIISVVSSFFFKHSLNAKCLALTDLLVQDCRLPARLGCLIASQCSQCRAATALKFAPFDERKQEHTPEALDHINMADNYCCTLVLCVHIAVGIQKSPAGC